VRTFNERAAASGLSALCVSKDLPFAQKRFCGAEGIENVMTASAFRDSFGRTTASPSPSEFVRLDRYATKKYH
jgi:peroxiredoxin